jgi:hypothetical protein
MENNNANKGNFVRGADGNIIFPPNGENVGKTVGMLGGLENKIENISVNFSSGATSSQFQTSFIPKSSYLQGVGGDLIRNAIGAAGLAEKHFRPIEIEAKKIKESQKSNLGEKLK